MLVVKKLYASFLHKQVINLLDGIKKVGGDVVAIVDDGNSENLLVGLNLVCNIVLLCLTLLKRNHG